MCDANLNCVAWLHELFGSTRSNAVPGGTGKAPVTDSCGTAGGVLPGMPQGSAGASYAPTPNAKIGDLGSKLPPLPTGVEWSRGSDVEVAWNFKAWHGGWSPLPPRPILFLVWSRWNVNQQTSWASPHVEQQQPVAHLHSWSRKLLSRHTPCGKRVPCAC